MDSGFNKQINDEGDTLADLLVETLQEIKEEIRKIREFLKKDRLTKLREKRNLAWQAYLLGLISWEEFKKHEEEYMKELEKWTPNPSEEAKED